MPFITIFHSILTSQDQLTPNRSVLSLHNNAFQLKAYICNGVKGTLTFVHRNVRCTSSQGLPGLGYGPPVAAVCLPRAGKAIAGGLPPTAVARDVMSYTSYRITSRWRVWSYVTVYVIYWRYKSGCNPVPGSPFVSQVAGD